MIDAQAVLADCFQAMFSQPIVENVLRGKLVESMVHLALSGHGWQRKDPWAGWDFEHTDKNRLEVKQAAARQTWDTTRTIDRKTNFDIAPHTGYYDTAGWVASERRCRLAQLYVFAYHPLIDAAADHRNPQQWEFYVAQSGVLQRRSAFPSQRCDKSHRR